jgi:hypothetical protein
VSAALAYPEDWYFWQKDAPDLCEMFEELAGIYEYDQEMHRRFAEKRAEAACRHYHRTGKRMIWFAGVQQEMF